MESRAPTAPSPATVPIAKMAAFAGAYAALILADRFFSAETGNGALFMPTPALLTAGLLIFPPRPRLRCFAFSLIAGLITYLAAAKNLPAAAGFWLSDLATAALAF